MSSKSDPYRKRCCSTILIKLLDGAYLALLWLPWRPPPASVAQQPAPSPQQWTIPSPPLPHQPQHLKSHTFLSLSSFPLASSHTILLPPSQPRHIPNPAHVHRHHARPNQLHHRRLKRERRPHRRRNSHTTDEPASARYRMHWQFRADVL